MIRCFVSLPVPEDVADVLDDWTTPIPGLLWIPSENYHVTLAFLGDVSPQDLVDYDAALAGVRAEAPTVTARDRGWFGGEKPRLLFAKIDPDPVLLDLRAKIWRALESAGFAPRHERYRPHVTLARLNARDDRAAGLEWTKGGADAPVSWRPDYFALYQSDLHPGGARYTELARYTF